MHRRCIQRHIRQAADVHGTLIGAVRVSATVSGEERGAVAQQYAGARGLVKDCTEAHGVCDGKAVVAGVIGVVVPGAHGVAARAVDAFRGHRVRW